MATFTTLVEYFCNAATFVQRAIAIVEALQVYQ
jgi:hypothetical protein